MGTCSKTFAPNHEEVKNNPKNNPAAPKTARDGALKIINRVSYPFKILNEGKTSFNQP